MEHEEPTERVTFCLRDARERKPPSKWERRLRKCIEDSVRAVGIIWSRLGEPEPDQAFLAKLAGIPDWKERYEERFRVGKAWSEALAAGDPTALKCSQELVDSMVDRVGHAGEFGEMINKWYVANRGELKFPEW
jgi:hypothetical protein